MVRTGDVAIMCAERSERRSKERDQRRQDLAEALRSNLRKRRNQVRARAERQSKEGDGALPVVDEK